MTDLKQPAVSFTSSSVEKMSRHEMLEWVNSTVHGQYKKIEELSNGVAYCQMMDLLFPNCLCLKKVKMSAKLEHEFLHNLKLFQAAFSRLNLDKSVPIDRLIKARFQDNFEFLQWFKKFFDTHAAGKENLKVPAALAAAAANCPRPIRKPGAAAPLAAKAKTVAEPSLKTPKGTQPSEERAVSPSSLRVLHETQEQLMEQITRIEHERNYYYKQLTAIEALVTDANDADEWSKRCLAILYDNGDTEGQFESADL